MNDYKSYAAYSKNNNVREGSSSGGVFSALAESVIQKNGVVYGVRFSEDFASTSFYRVTDLDELDRLRGSKYIQAEVGTAFIDAKNDLEQGKHVLFSGTPCQINGFKLFLRKEYEKLICVDIICHGVPSNKLWNEHVKYMENKAQSYVVGVNQRNKKYGWIDFGTSVIFLNGKRKYNAMFDDEYMNLFLRNIALRPSCYKCKSREHRLADLTLADFWGIWKIDSEVSDNKGISLVICRTEKGQDALCSMSNIKKKEMDYNDAIRYNPAEYKSPLRPKERDSFYQELVNESYEYVARKYYNKTFFTRLEDRAKRMIRYLFW